MDMTEKDELLFEHVLGIFNQSRFRIVGSKIRLNITDEQKAEILRLLNGLFESAHDQRYALVRFVKNLSEHLMIAGDTANISDPENRKNWFYNINPSERFLQCLNNLMRIPADRAAAAFPQAIDELCSYVNDTVSDALLTKMPVLHSKAIKPAGESRYFLMRSPTSNNSDNQAYKEKIEEQGLPMNQSLFGQMFVPMDFYAKWHATKRSIELLGGKVILVPEEALARGCFVRDASLILSDGYLIEPDFSFASTEYESSYREICANQIFGEHKFITDLFKGNEAITVSSEKYEYEGGNILHADIDGRKIALIRGSYTSTGLQKLGMELYQRGYNIIPVTTEGHDERKFFHLDQMASLLPRGEIMLYPDYFSGGTLAMIERQFEGKVIYADKETVMAMGLNLLAPTDNNLLMPFCSDSTKQKLVERGYNVYTAKEMGLRSDDYLAHTGGPHCFAMELPKQAITQELLKTNPGIGGRAS